MSSSLDKQRVTANNPAVVKKLCTVVQRTVYKHKMPTRNIGNMDRKGCMLCQAAKCKVLCRAGRRYPHLKQDGNREMVTDIKIVSAAGHILPSYIIYKRSYLMGLYAGVKGDEDAQVRFA